MFTLRDNTIIHAPIDRCFLLSTSVVIVQKELGMHPVEGRTSGLVTAGDKVLWKGWQLGLPQFHHSLISRFEPFRFFQDTMVAGRFKSFQHDHAFDTNPDGSITLADELRFSMPLGIFGWLVGRLIMVPHIRGLLRRRFRLLKRIAETDQWRDYLPDGETHLTV
jgi:ligand-binding SRPBCC domain-containing protein